jgi:hypothetical protein
MQLSLFFGKIIINFDFRPCATFGATSWLIGINVYLVTIFHRGKFKKNKKINTFLNENSSHLFLFL